MKATPPITMKKLIHTEQKPLIFKESKIPFAIKDAARLLTVSTNNFIVHDAAYNFKYSALTFEDNFT